MQLEATCAILFAPALRVLLLLHAWGQPSTCRKLHSPLQRSHMIHVDFLLGAPVWRVLAGFVYCRAGFVFAQLGGCRTRSFRQAGPSSRQLEASFLFLKLGPCRHFSA
mmetsp:Transcript_2824/g.9443  ORF Transcript_2824/g.9443 Transcript_2824/m.9443 type:complete len:108 (-) Transcript_2824:199-522(-)